MTLSTSPVPAPFWPRGPWLLAAFERLPLAPWLGAALLALLWFVAVVALETLTGWRSAPGHSGASFWRIPGWWTQLVNGCMIGFAPAVMAYSVRRSQRELAALAPILRDPPPASIPLPAGWLRGVGLAVALGGAAFSYFDPGSWTTRARPGPTDWFLWFTLGRHALIGWLWGRAVVVDLATGRWLGRQAARIAPLDLLDLAPLMPFTRRAVQSLFVWMLGMVLFSLFWLGPDPGRSNGVTFLLLMGCAGAGVLAPLVDVHVRLRDEKQARLARIRREIRSDQEVLLAATGAETRDAAQRLPALYAAETRTEAVREWPFDAPTLVRIGLYLLLGIGSWLGGAVVERLLEAAIGA